MSTLGIAQDRFHINIDHQSDLKTNTIYDILEDHNGYIWLSTELGLCKYNGQTYHYYLSNNLSSTAGSNLKQDKYNRVWYQNFDGYLYFVENDSLKTLPNQEPTVHYSNFAIIDDMLLTLARNGINIYNIKEKKFIKNIPLNTQNAFTAIQSGNYFYILSDKIINRVDHLGKIDSITYFKDRNIEINYFTNKHNKGIIIFDKQNVEKTAYFLDDKKLIKEAFRFDSKYFIQNARVINNNLYLLTSHGAIWYELHLHSILFCFQKIIYQVY